MIEAEGSIEIGRPVGEVFAFVCDLSRAPSWLEGCVELALVNPGPWSRGAALRYVHRQGGHEGTLGGVVAEFEPDRAIRMEFSDTMFGIAVGLRFDAVPGGTRVAHTVAIELKSFAARLLSPVIKVANQKQVVGNLARLQRLVESAG